MIRIEGLKKEFKNFALEIDELEIGPGEYFVIVGDSGSGKTVFLEIMAGLIRSDSGKIFVGDEDVNLLPIQKRPFGLVFQDQALFPHMNVEENIAFALKNTGMKPGDIRARTRELAQMLEVGDLLERNVAKISGGEKQRVALARTLARNPECFLLDEPLSALDTRLRKEIRSVLRWLNRMDNTIIHVTHDFEEAINLATHIGVMENGRIIQAGPADQVLREPRSSFVANFTGVRNYFKVTLIRDEENAETIALTSDNIKIRLSTDKSSGNGYVIIPPEAIVLSDNKILSSAANQFKGEIIDISPARHGFEVHIKSELNLVALVTAGAIKKMQLKTGNTVWASFKATNLRFIRK